MSPTDMAALRRRAVKSAPERGMTMAAFGRAAAMALIAAVVCAPGAWAAALAGDGAAPAVPGSSPRRTMSGDDFYRTQELSDPQVSPDGAWVAYVVTVNDRDADEQRSSIWMVSWDGRERVRLTSPAPRIEAPRWSPDGRYLAYLDTPEGTDDARLMLMDRRGGAARPVTAFAGGVREYTWSPDGRRVAAVIDVTADGRADAGGKGSPKPIVIRSLHFKEDHEAYLQAGAGRHLAVYTLEDGNAAALTRDPGFNESAPVWSPDGAHLAFVRTRGIGADPDGRVEIDVIDSRAGATPITLARPYAPNAQKLAWSPEGGSIAYLQGAEPRFYSYMQDHLFWVPASGGMPKAAAPQLDRAITSYAFSGSSALQITVEDDGSEYPARLELDKGTVTAELGGTGGSCACVITSLSSAGGHTAVLRSTDATFPEVFALENGAARQLTGHNDALLTQLRLGPVEDVKFKSKDGTEVHGLLVKPPDYVAGKRYPLLLWIHGGPNGGDEHTLAFEGYEFEKQLFAAKGYLVLRVNYRGGSGRGAAYARAIVADWGHKEVQDLLAGVDAMVTRGLADPDRLAVGGWSYGGILTDYTIASDRRFKAAISGAGSANQLSTYGTDQYILQYNNELGPPWKDPALWVKVSYPFFHADRIHTPTLFLGGTKDFNVPVSGSEQMYQALRTLGVPAELVIYPEQNHIVTRPSFLVDMASRMSDWLDQYVPR